jgi:hypothetical protein
MQGDAMVPQVHTQIEAIAFAFIDDLHAHDLGCVDAPSVEIGHR